jgi:hypothetical protein
VSRRQNKRSYVWLKEFVVARNFRWKNRHKCIEDWKCMVREKSCQEKMCIIFVNAATVNYLFSNNQILRTEISE